MTRKQALLIAGAVALDDLAAEGGLIGGGGAYAAIAAAPLAPTQLWSRAGMAFGAPLRGILERRRIDLSGCSFDGATPRWSSAEDRFVAEGSLLPEVEPTTADELGAALVIGLPPADGRRALAAIARLPGSAERPVLVAPRAADCRADPAWLADACRAARVLLLPAAAAVTLTGAATPLAAAAALRERGAEAVALSAGELGGLLLYQHKATTWPAMPVAIVDPTGVGSAFAGALAAWCATEGAADFRTLKRGLAMASGIAAICGQGPGPRKLLAADSAEYFDRFNRLRRAAKY